MKRLSLKQCLGSVLAALAVVMIAACSRIPLQVAGGGSDTEVSGRVVASDGLAARGAVVYLIKPTDNPAFNEGLFRGPLDTVDSAGNYSFQGLAQGAYNLQVVRMADGTKLLVDSVVADSGKAKTLPDAALKKTATLIVPVPDSLNALSGFIAMPGTLLWKYVSQSSHSVKFDSVPQGTLSSINYYKSPADPAIVLFTNITIASSDTVFLNPLAAWTHSAKVMLNPAALGFTLSQPLVNFPVLVRLTSSNFVFGQAKFKGEDIRFIRPDSSLVPFEIEQWDTATSTASLWVKIDTVYPNTTNQFVTMLWGNPTAKTYSNPAAVFDTASGFRGVWHLQASGISIQKDATYNKFDGTPEAMTGSSDVSGTIARAQNFDGSSQCISMLNARNSALDVQTDSFYTVSAWVYVRTLNKGLHVFVSKGSAQYGLMINKQNAWEFYAGLTGYGVDTTTTYPAVANTWTHVIGVRNGMKQYLYINGVLKDSTLAAAGTSVNISNNFYDFIIGRQSDDQSQWFDGIVDEVRVEGTARSADWARMSYENQRSDQVFGQLVR